jgi:hypothetical protein
MKGALRPTSLHTTTYNNIVSLRRTARVILWRPTYLSIQYYYYSFLVALLRLVNIYLVVHPRRS